MSYGLRVLGGNDLLQIDSDIVGMSGYGLKAQGVGSSAPYSSGDLVFVNKNQSGSSTGCFPDWLASSVNFLTGTGSPISMNYIVIGPMLTGSAPIDNSTYGLQVFDPEGNLAFDSRRIGTGPVMPTPTRVIPSGTLVGVGDTIASAAVLPNGRREWICINFGRYEPYIGGDQTLEGLTLGSGLMKYYHAQNTDEFGSFAYGQSSDILIVEA